MSKQIAQDLRKIIKDSPWSLPKRIEEYANQLEKADKGQPKPRTIPQHNSLFLWFSMIEKEAENMGITWDMIIRHTHQLRVTKENLHSMCKELQKALWGSTSTKQLKKNGEIDIIIEHFTDLFAKEGLELPPFPSNEIKTPTEVLVETQIEYPVNNLGEQQF